MSANDLKHHRDCEGEANWFHGILASAGTRKMYGKITVHLENGRIKKVLSETSLKPPK